MAVNVISKVDDQVPVWDDAFQKRFASQDHHDSWYSCSIIERQPKWFADVVFPFEWERNYDGNYLMQWTYDYWMIPIITVALYVTFVFFGQKFMEDREGYNLNKTMKYWNLFLAVFSIIGFLRTAPQLFHSMAYWGLDYTFCRDGAKTWASGAGGFWGFLFVYSKYAELVDTIILVLRKKPVIFLHWYHHATVMLVSLAGFAAAQPTSQYFCVMNYAVHSVMYHYYYLMACGQRPSWAKAITVAQITQMVIGFAVNVYQAYKIHTDSTCSGSWSILLIFSVVYVSYFALFVNFAIARYITKAKTIPAQATETGEKLKMEKISVPNPCGKEDPCGKDDELLDCTFVLAEEGTRKRTVNVDKPKDE